MSTQRPPKDGYRAVSAPASVDEENRLTGHFARFGVFNEINSSLEGRFLERIEPGAFTKTFAEQTPKVLFNHGKDPSIGDQPIAVVRSLTEDEAGPAFDVELLDGIPPLVRSGLKAGQYGVSYRFRVIREDWKEHPGRSDYNPEGLPERTIRESGVFEFGPVTFPADKGADVAYRSMTDEFTAATLAAASAPAETPTLTAPSVDAGETHLEPERRAEPIPATPEVPERESAVEYVTREDKASRVTELKASIVARAAEHTGVFPGEVQALDDDENRELDRLVADIAAYDARAARIASFSDSARHTETTYSPQPFNIAKTVDIYDMSRYTPGQVRSAEDRDQKLRDGAMRSLETSRFAQSNVDQDRAKEGVSELLDTKDTRDKELANRILITGSPSYRKAFTDSLRTMRPTPELERAAALAVTGTTTTGGYMLPYQFDPSFIKTGAWTNINPYRQVCRVEQIVGANKWQGVSVGAVPAIYETEALAVTEAGPTFSNPSVQTQRASAFVSLSYETLQDKPDIITELADLIQEGKDTLEEAQFSVGVGTTVYPLGMFVKSTFTVKETATDDTFAVADLDATEAALPLRHRRDAIWMLSRAVIRIIQGFETVNGKLFNSTLGYPAVGNIANNPGGNTGLSLLGYPVWETPSAPATVTTDDTIVGILVSPKNYIIVDRVGMNVELVPNLIDGNGKVTGQRGVFAMFRNSAKALNADAGRQININ